MPSSSARLHEEAAAEYDAAFDWYLERRPDAALKFDAEVDRAIGEIIQAPRRWPVGPFGTRRFLLRQFPFILFYRERGREKFRLWLWRTPAESPGTGGSG